MDCRLLEEESVLLVQFFVGGGIDFGDYSREIEVREVGQAWFGALVGVKDGFLQDGLSYSGLLIGGFRFLRNEPIFGLGRLLFAVFLDAAKGVERLVEGAVVGGFVTHTD